MALGGFSFDIALDSKYARSLTVIDAKSVKGESNSNSYLVRCVHFHTNALENGTKIYILFPQLWVKQHARLGFLGLASSLFRGRKEILNSKLYRYKGKLHFP